MDAVSNKKLAIFVPDLAFGGAQRSILKLASGLAQRQNPVDLVLGIAEGPLLKEVPPTVRLVNLHSRRASAALPGLIKYLKTEKPFSLLSVLHGNIIALWGWRLARVSARIIVSERSTLSQESKHYRGDLRNRFMPNLARVFYPWAYRVVAVSQGVANDLVDVIGIPREKIQVIYNPIITPEMCIKVQEPWLSSGTSDKDLPIVLSVGRLATEKGFDTLIKAFAAVVKETPAKLVILGDGPQKESLTELARQLGVLDHVHLPGFVENPYPWMAHAQVFVLSSRWEGLPGVLIEAMYCGARIVSTDCPHGAREILSDGKYGKLVGVDDVQAMSSGILAAIKGDFSKPPTESWQRFKSETIINQYTRILFE